MNLFTLLKCKSLAIFLFISTSFYSFGQKTWIGAGAGGTSSNFNLASNWSPAGVPGASDNVTITATSYVQFDFTADVAINNLTFTVSGDNTVARLYVGAYKLTINGTTVITVSSGNSSTSARIGVFGGTSAGVVDFRGNVTIAAAGSATGNVGLVGNSNSKLIFRGDLTLNQNAYTPKPSSGFAPGTFEFDGTGVQTITWNATGYYCSMPNVVIGNSNNPTINQVTGAQTPGLIVGNLTINGSSVLNLGTSQWNGGTESGSTGNGGTLTLNGTSRLQLGAASGGQTGSNFPLGFSALSIAAGSVVEYTGTTSQTVYDIPSPGYGHLTLTNNSTKSAASDLDIRGNLSINPTATFSAGALTHNLGGNFINDNIFTQGSSTMVFNGMALQNISGATATTFYNLTTNNTAGNTTKGITLNKPTTVTNTLKLTKGHITTSSTNLLIMTAGSNVAGSSYGAPGPKVMSGGDVNSFINGPMRKIGNTAFLFPVGKISTGTATTYGHHPCGISAPSVVTDAFTAEYIRGSAAYMGSVSAAGLDHVSNCEYWNIARTTGTSAVNVSLSWTAASDCNSAVYVNDIPTMKAAHFNGSTWDSYGGLSDASSAVTEGSVTWNSVSTFSLFSLGSTSSSTNPLPVKLANVKAYRSGNTNKVEWSNLTEMEVVKYEVERSSSGNSFSPMNSVAPRTNSTGREDYNVLDLQPPSLAFYRIKVISLNGEVLYSPVVKVANTNAATELSLYPNPVTGRQLTLYVNNSKAGVYNLRIYAANGQLIKTEAFRHGGGSYSRTIELPEHLQAGQYFMQAVDANGQVSVLKFITQ